MIKPCPFCGSSDITNHENFVTGATVHCTKCQSNGPIAIKIEKAIDAWNTRAIPDEQLSPDEKLLQYAREKEELNKIKLGTSTKYPLVENHEEELGGNDFILSVKPRRVILYNYEQRAKIREEIAAFLWDISTDGDREYDDCSEFYKEYHKARADKILEIVERER